MNKKVLYLFLFIKKLIAKIDTDKITVYSAQAAFHIITAFIPFLSFAVILMKFFIKDQREEFILMVVSFFPKTLSDFIEGIINELFSRNSASVISLSSIVSLWSASKGVLAVRLGLNEVYHTKVSENYVKKRASAILYTLILLLMIVFSLGILVFGNSLTVLLYEKAPKLAFLIRILLSFKSVVSVFVFSVVFALLYKYLPYQSEKRSFSSQIPGAVATSISWITFSYFYGLYIDNYSNYSYLYGSIAAIVLMLLWVYFCLIMLLFGAEINEFFKDVYFPFKRKNKGMIK